MFIDRYKPKSLDEMVLNPNTRAGLESLTKNDLSFILYGPPGCGKTCFVEILLSDPEADWLKIDVEDQTVDYIRDKLKQYCGSVFNFTGKNYVILNECDKLSRDAQTILKDYMDGFVKNNRFAFITNEIEKINEAIRSRLVNVEFKNPSNEDVLKHFKNILGAEGLELDHKTEQIIKTVSFITKKKGKQKINSGYIDFRFILNKLENIC